jgi:hypothetical protein
MVKVSPGPGDEGRTTPFPRWKAWPSVRLPPILCFTYVADGFAAETRVCASRPTACSPRAWATATPLGLARAMLNLNAVDGRLVLDPDVPPEIGRIRVDRVSAFGQRWDLAAVGRRGRLRLAAE